MHASRGVPAAHAYQSEKSSIRLHEKIVTVHPDSGAAEIVSVCVARGDVGGASKSDISSRFVASKCSQGVDVQRYCLEDRHAVRFVELKLEMVAVAAMLAASS